MGICIYYKGQLKTRDSLPKMIEEAKDIAEIHHWDYHIFEKNIPENDFGKKSFNKDIYGILFSPPNCEPVQLTFLSNGKMCSSWNFKSEDSSEQEEDKNLSNTLFTKTQFAGPAIHKLIINLFDYFKEKYFENFELEDEAQYWETKDEKLLYKNFKILDDLINSFGERLESNDMLPNETFESYILRITKEIHNQTQKNK